jgi:hypothetical protein
MGAGEGGASAEDQGEGGGVQRGDGCDGADDVEDFGDGWGVVQAEEVGDRIEISR